MTRQPGKRSRQSKQATFERKATQLREKARERLAKLPEPAQRGIQVAQEAAGLLFAPLRIGLRLVREVLEVPLAILRVLRHKEA